MRTMAERQRNLDSTCTGERKTGKKKTKPVETTEVQTSTSFVDYLKPYIPWLSQTVLPRPAETTDSSDSDESGGDKSDQSLPDNAVGNNQNPQVLLTPLDAKLVSQKTR